MMEIVPQAASQLGQIRDATGFGDIGGRGRSGFAGSLGGCGSGGCFSERVPGRVGAEAKIRRQHSCPARRHKKKPYQTTLSQIGERENQRKSVKKAKNLS